MTRHALAACVAVAFLSCIVIANYLTSTYGFVPVGFGYMSTAGTFAAGAAFAARDALQDLAGKRATLIVIALGAGLSYLVADPFIATASAVAFLLSEVVDLAVYTPLRAKSRLGGRRWAAAVVASNVVGAAVDTVVFLAMAFGWSSVRPAYAGQMVGKAWATVIYLVLGKGVGWCATSRTPRHRRSVTR